MGVKLNQEKLCWFTPAQRARHGLQSSCTIWVCGRMFSFNFPWLKKKKKEKILYEIIIICSFLVSPLECAQDWWKEMTCNSIPIKCPKSAVHNSFAGGLFSTFLVPTGPISCVITNFFKLKVLWRQFPATSNFHITFSGPCSLRTTATTKSISSGVLDGVTWITKNQNAQKMCSKKWVLLTHCWWF